MELSFDYVSGDTPIAKWRVHLLASGDLLRVARKSDSLRFRWVYRIRRDRSHRVLSCLDTRPFGALFRLIRLPGKESANRQIQGSSGPAVRRCHYFLPRAPLFCKLTRMSLASPYMLMQPCRQSCITSRSKFSHRRLRCSSRRVLLIRFMHALQAKAHV